MTCFLQSNKQSKNTLQSIEKAFETFKQDTRPPPKSYGSQHDSFTWIGRSYFLARRPKFFNRSEEQERTNLGVITGVMRGF